MDIMAILTGVGEHIITVIGMVTGTDIMPEVIILIIITAMMVTVIIMDTEVIITGLLFQLLPAIIQEEIIRIS
jgi:hypothetical protein